MTVQIPPVSPGGETEYPMEEKRNTVPNDRSGETRQIPTARKAAHAQNSATRQIPTANAARQTNPAHAQNSATRQIPTANAARQANPAHAQNSATRQIPTANAARQVNPAHAQNSATRQIPTANAARQANPAQVQNSATKQIPAANAARQANPARPGVQKAAQEKPAAKASAAASHAPKKIATAETVQVPATDATKQINSKELSVKANDHADAPELSIKKKSRPRKKVASAGTGAENSVISIVKAVVYIVAVLVVSIVASVFIILVGNDVYAFVKSDQAVEITIPAGADLNDVASILSDNDIIKYPSIFKMYAKRKHYDRDSKGNPIPDEKNFVAGTYSISPDNDYEDLLAAFKEKAPEGTSWVTIPEGYTTDEIINLLVETGIGTKEKYVDVINNYAFDYWFVTELDATDWKSTGRYYRLDGYLFPDTYEFYNASSEKTVIEKMLARFNVIFVDKYREAAQNMNLTTDQIVTIASMIEKEAGRAADYHLVSSVFHNRLASPYYPKLESDATVLYAIHHDTGTRPNVATPEDMTYDSPYNTYTHEGLPPGPIANPSASSINAALTPEKTDYYYFVSYAGNTYFSSSKEGHDANIAMIKAKRDAAQQNQN